MKKIFVIFIALATTMVACNKVSDVNEPQDAVKQIVFNMEVNQGDAQDTKAVKTNWEEGDKVYVFFKGLVGTNKYAVFTYDGSSWTKSANGIVPSDLSGIAEANKQLTAVYFPFGAPTFTANGDLFEVAAEQSYYLSVNTSYTSAVMDASLVLSATLNMTVPDGFVQFSMPNTDGTNTFFRETPVYTLTDSHLAPVSVTAITPGSAPTQTEITDDEDADYGQPLKGYFYGEGKARCILFSGILKEGARGYSTTYNFTFVNNMETVATYDDVTYKYSVTATLYQGASSWRAVKFPLISSNRWKVPEPEFVTVDDVKWAKWNVGATTEAGYGDYFAWGAIYPQYNYEGGEYQESGIITGLSPEKDVAYQKLGSVWHMPTKVQLEALSSKIPSSTWVTDYKGSGVKGYLITADNGEDKLFLPAAGCWYGMLNGAGGSGFYWSSTYSSKLSAWRLDFNSTSAIVFNILVSRSSGNSVRPVHN